MGKSSKNKLPDLRKQDIFKPLDLNQIGSNGDPCFGKQYDLSTKECKICGDSELCAIKFAGVMKMTRKELEKKNSYKDTEPLLDTRAIQKYVRNKIRKGAKRSEAFKAAAQKFETSRSNIRNLFKD